MGCPTPTGYATRPAWRPSPSDRSPPWTRSIPSWPPGAPTCASLTDNSHRRSLEIVKAPLPRLRRVLPRLCEGESSVKVPLPRLHLYDDSRVFYGDRVALGHVRAGHQLHRVSAHAGPCRVDERLTCADVELPPMPGAAQDLAPPQIPVFTGRARHDEPAEHALTQRPTLMGTDVAQGEELPADIEYPYRAAFQRDDAATAGRDVCGWRYR